MGSADAILANIPIVGFSNPSATAPEKLIAQGVGGVMDNVLTEFTNTKNSILAVINNQRYGRSGYYVTAAKGFQFGDNLVPTGPNLDPGYAVIDPTKQIITQAAFQNAAGALSIKVATLNTVSGLLQQLTVSQLAAFKSYFINFEIPGIPVSIVSLPGNIFGFSAACTFNAGYDRTILEAGIQAALASFNATFDFNGLLYSDQLSDYVKAQVPGVIDFFVSATTIDGVVFNGSTNLTAGYFNYIINVFNNITFLPINA